MSISLPTTSGTLFCEVSSVAPYYASNLQLFSLRQAFQYWNELNAKRGSLTTCQIKEYLVFIIVCAGTSVTQLFGQNAIHSDQGSRVATPKALFDQIFGEGHPKRRDFLAFIDLYNDCRHFGSPKYPSIEGLTEEVCKQQLDFVVALWDEMIQKYCDEGSDPDGELGELETVASLLP